MTKCNFRAASLTVGLASILGSATAVATPYNFTVIDFPTSVSNNLAIGINDQGTIVGYRSNSDSLHIQPYIRTSDGSYSTLPDSGNSLLGPAKITNDGSVVGTARNNLGIYHAFVYSGGTYQYYDGPGATFGTNGSVLVSNVLYGTSDTPSASISYSQPLPNGPATTYTYPGASTTAVSGANAAGWLAGSYYADNHPQPFYYDGTYHAITIPTAVWGYAFGVNDSGVVAGDFYDGSHHHAFILDAGDLTIVDAPGAVDTGFYDLNNRGQYVGYSRDAFGNQHGLLVDTPEPATLSLFAAAALGLAAVRRARPRRRLEA